LILNHFQEQCKELPRQPCQNRDRTTSWAETVPKFQSQQDQ